MLLLNGGHECTGLPSGGLRFLAEYVSLTKAFVSLIFPPVAVTHYVPSLYLQSRNQVDPLLRANLTRRANGGGAEARSMIRVSSILKRQDTEANLSDPFTGKRPSTGEEAGESGVKLLPAANLPLGSLYLPWKA